MYNLGYPGIYNLGYPGIYNLGYPEIYNLGYPGIYNLGYPWNPFLEIQAHGIRLGAIQESMDLAQELWKSIKPLRARALGPVIQGA